ncbi:maleylpyruvate isomerase N-terminal domain-containing protein [Streptomyces sp. NPDC093094]|uniref:maleylpyruvate isomerase N-terminal domain-containing protein n=1 Tax=Streptomyces sp. NPDC093094 TaxID=3366026 RepID=UPI00382FDD82
MTESLEHSALLRLIDERSAAFRSAVAAAPGLDAPVPSCPEWTLFDLVQHLGTGQRWWAAIVAAGPAEAPPAKDAAEAPRELEALLAWYAESNELLLSALREAGPERECWTWWRAGVSPANARGVARRRVHEGLRLPGGVTPRGRAAGPATWKALCDRQLRTRTAFGALTLRRPVSSPVRSGCTLRGVDHHDIALFQDLDGRGSGRCP